MEVNEENETLMKQYDREKQRRKEIEEVHMHPPSISMCIIYTCSLWVGVQLRVAFFVLALVIV